MAPPGGCPPPCATRKAGRPRLGDQGGQQAVSCPTATGPSFPSLTSRAWWEAAGAGRCLGNRWRLWHRGRGLGLDLGSNPAFLSSSYGSSKFPVPLPSQSLPKTSGQTLAEGLRVGDNS